MPDKELMFTNTLAALYVEFLLFYSASAADFYVDPFVLRDISKRYFKDVDRLHRYHGIDRINACKIAGYTTYWISKMKPISIVNPAMYKNQSEFCIYINEIFAIYVSSGRLISKDEVKSIRISKNFLDTFLYTLKYRSTSGDNLSMIYNLIEMNNANKTA
jgi:hypothetical protein